METHIPHYDVTLIYSAYTKCGEIQMASLVSNGLRLVYKASIYSESDINTRKQLLNLVLVEYEKLLRPCFVFSGSGFVLGR